MPDLARSTSEMLEEMKKIVQQPEGNTSCAKHRQNVASAITTLIKEQITDAPFRQLYIADAAGKKGTTKSAPLLLQLSASMQEMCSFMLGTNCNWAVVPTATITTTLCSPPPAPTSAKKPRGRPPADPAAKAAAALKKMQEAHNKAIDDWDAAFENRQRFLDAGIGDEFKGWERDLERMREELNKLDAMSDEFDAKNEDIKRQKGRMMTAKKAYEAEIDRFDKQLATAHENIVLPGIDQHFRHIPNWEGYQLPSPNWCKWFDDLETYMKDKYNDQDMPVHGKKEADWFAKMHQEMDPLDTFYPEEKNEEEDEEDEEPAPASAPPPKRRRRGEK